MPINREEVDAEVTGYVASTDGVGNTNTHDGNVFTIHNESDSTRMYYPYCKVRNTNYVDGEDYLLKATIVIHSGTAYLDVSETGNGYVHFDDTLEVGTYVYTGVTKFGNDQIILRFDGQIETTFDATVTLETTRVTLEDLYVSWFDAEVGLYVYKYLPAATVSDLYDLGKADGTGDFQAHTMSNFIVSKQPFTDAQKDSRLSRHEKFLYREDGVLKSTVLSPSDITSIVIYLPMCETGSDVYDIAQESPVAHAIQNYTAACRDNANQLSKGLQTCFWKRDVTGVPYAASFDRFECDGTGYANTGWTPNGTYQIEEVTGLDGTYTHRVYSSDDAKYTNGSSDGTFNVPSTEVVLNAANIEGVSIDVYRLFKVHEVSQDPVALYNAAIKKGLLA